MIDAPRVIGWIRDLLADSVTVAAGIDDAGKLRPMNVNPGEVVARELARMTTEAAADAIRIHDVVAETAPAIVSLYDIGRVADRVIVENRGDTDATVALTAAVDASEIEDTLAPFAVWDRALRDGFSEARVTAVDGAVAVRIEARYA